MNSFVLVLVLCRARTLSSLISVSSSVLCPPCRSCWSLGLFSLPFCRTCCTPYRASSSVVFVVTWAACLHTFAFVDDFPSTPLLPSLAVPRRPSPSLDVWIYACVCVCFARPWRSCQITPHPIRTNRMTLNKPWRSAGRCSGQIRTMPPVFRSTLLPW